jgi:L,D-transpeptidase ErfK/SrfK
MGLKRFRVQYRRSANATDRSGFFRLVRHFVLLAFLLAGVQALSLGNSEASQMYRFTASEEVLGRIRAYTVRNDESLYEIARTFKTGINEVIAANPGVDPILPEPGTSLVLPTSWILPETVRRPGIVINLSEMRLYYFAARGRKVTVRTYPVGIGDEGSDTPVGVFRVIQKIAHPSWYVPASIRKERPELPAVVPPGPDNPMGSHALRLSRRTVLIHGTDSPWGIGGKVSHGCIRLYPEDIVELFRLVPVNTRVTIVRQPVKIGVSKGHIYVEVIADKDLKGFDYLRTAKKLLRKRRLLAKVDRAVLARAVGEKRGVPVNVSRIR